MSVAGALLASPHGLLLADESKKSGPIGFAVILVLCVACYFLFKSMSRHLRKVREEFPQQDVEPTDVAPTDVPPHDTAQPPAGRAQHDRPDQT